ncbi:MAG: 4Fe-4S dicluster domain-containing protein [Candidatus Zixiibacteriota bacterium]|nr:MAG: 4Fe-4S dicluster domain-containing protein [candidate division Zixibacteria bacterium]
MSMDRRKFMRVSGLAALGLAGGASRDLLAQETPPDTTRAPLTGSRWALVVDLRKCMAAGDCTDCSQACHRTHNVPEFDNPKDEIKWIWKESFEHVFEEQEHEFLEEALKHVKTPVLCNHCDNPPCVRVCPTQATWKREQDGIVMMDWHRCIGCRYCVLACPYGSRSFNWRDPRPFIKEIKPDFPTRSRGVVEKCTFCEERLARGLQPSCVEACKERALIFGDLEDPDSEVRRLLKERFTIRRKPGLGTQPEVYYMV